MTKFFYHIGVLFELGLGLLALAIGWLIGYDLWRDLRLTGVGLLWGALAVLPMLPVLLICDHWSIRPLRRVRSVLEQLLIPHLRECTYWELGLLSLAAGLGEETMFRGLLQGGLSDVAGWGVGLAVASLIFGFLHALTPTYAILATGIGVYLGLIYGWSGNLLVPMVAHGLYDFLALVYFLRTSVPDTIEPNPIPEGSDDV